MSSFAARLWSSAADRQRGDPSVDESVAIARALLQLRRRRDAFFGNIFGEASWDLLLHLYVARSERRLVTVSAACSAAAVPQTTALRWIASLEDCGTIVRHPDQTDRRRIHLQLSDRAFADMRALLIEEDDSLVQGLP